MTALPSRKHLRLPLDDYRSGHAFHVTINTHSKQPWFAGSELAEAAEELLAEHPGLYAWCILPDHIHLLLTAPDLVSWVRTFKGRLAPVFRRLHPGERLWQRSFHDRALRAEQQLEAAALYVWSNAVEAEFVDAAGEYRWAGSTVWPDWREWDENR